MDTLLARFPEIDVVYAQDDRMAAGAYAAAMRRKREKGMRFVGTDAIPGEDVYKRQPFNGLTDTYALPKVRQ